MPAGTPSRRRPPRPLGVPVLVPVPKSWWFDGLLLAGLVALTAGLIWWPPLLRLDIVVRDWCDQHRPDPVSTMMWFFDHLGQGGILTVVTVLVSFWLAWRHRTVRPIIPAGLAPIVSTLLIVGLKRWTSRGAPHHGSVEMFSDGWEEYYPSGHVSNGIVYYGVLAMLLSPYLSVLARRLLMWVPGVLTFIGTTYLGYHWLTDSIAGYLLGLLIVRLLLRVPWRTLPLPRWLDRRGRVRDGDPAAPTRPGVSR
ncbi:phosphatase PAP2 family protein [Micromonospora costi]|uniref:Phosphatase PAP2 family protein n=1 Tax=Micromonospora costi TaxID=1530042 RepID=A0A3A9ZX91_9ACTN|nr:phosphatase PAP2 family protein [Micromonospora costi]RKN52790.1 phosphatase PAP2 family protein [Micromonospora costi]